MQNNNNNEHQVVYFFEGIVNLQQGVISGLVMISPLYWSSWTSSLQANARQTVENSTTAATKRNDCCSCIARRQPTLRNEVKCCHYTLLYLPKSTH